jgi:putative transcriptional regulator
MSHDRKLTAVPTHGIRWALALAISVALLLGGAPSGARAQQNIPTDRAFVLVATRDMPDPTFAHTVILMLPPHEIPVLVVGLIVNRPTTIPVNVLFPDSAKMTKEREEAYFGGPVDPTDPSVVVRAASAPAGALPAFADIYAVFDQDAVKQVLKAPSSTKDLRVILGRSQWALDQLHGEVMQGSWYVMPADASMVFSTDGMRLWRDLVDRGKLLETSIERRTVPIALGLPPEPWDGAAR